MLPKGSSKEDVLRKRRKTSPARPSWTWPTLSTRVSQGVTERHVALDIPGRRGDPVFAPYFGTVRDIKWQEDGYGLNVRITTDTGYEVILGHLDAVVSNLKPGQRVTPGQQVGLLGSTGDSTAPHVHFEVRPSTYATDRFRPGSGSGIGAIDPRFLFGGSPSMPTAAKTPISTGAYTFAPVTKPSVSLSGGTPEKIIAGAGLGAALQRPAAVAGAAVGAVKPGEISLGRVGVLPVTIAKPGAKAIQYSLIAVGLLLVFIGVVYLFRNVPFTPGWVVKRNVQGAGIVSKAAKERVASAVAGGQE